MAIDASGGGGGEKKQRVDGQGDPSESVGADAIPADPISALPDELRQRILTHLPLKDAVRTGAVARGWGHLWRCRWAHRGSVDLHLRSRDAPRIELDALECEPRPRRRLDRFSFIVDTCKLESLQLRRFIEYAAECRVEDLHVEVRKTTAAEKLNFHLPLASPRLSLRRISISFSVTLPSSEALGIRRSHRQALDPLSAVKPAKRGEVLLMRRLGEVGVPVPLRASTEAMKQFFEEGPPPHHMDALSDLFPMLKNKSKTSPFMGSSVD